MKYILFDIDGTLIDSGGAGLRSMTLAFEETFSVNDALRGISMAGKTDVQILRECMNIHGLAFSDGIIPEFFDAYIAHLKQQVANGKGHIKKGIREALDILIGEDGCLLGLLTGNIEEGARIKLEAFDLSRYFTVGAFGSDDEDRNRLLGVAVDKLYLRHSVKVGFGDCIVIGDTPRDIDCARPFGALSIAVATGPYSYQALADAGADLVFEDLSDTREFLSALGRGSACPFPWSVC